MSNSKTPKPKYSAKVPEFVLTPDKVETEHLGELEFFDGLPNETTVEKVYSFLDLSRGVHAFLNGMPAAFLYAMLEGLKDIGPQRRSEVLFTRFRYASKAAISINHIWPIFMPFSAPERNIRRRYWML